MFILQCLKLISTIHLDLKVVCYGEFSRGEGDEFVYRWTTPAEKAQEEKQKGEGALKGNSNKEKLDLCPIIVTEQHRSPCRVILYSHNLFGLS